MDGHPGHGPDDPGVVHGGPSPLRMAVEQGEEAGRGGVDPVEHPRRHRRRSTTCSVTTRRISGRSNTCRCSGSTTSASSRPEPHEVDETGAWLITWSGSATSAKCLPGAPGHRSDPPCRPVARSGGRPLRGTPLIQVRRPVPAGDHRTVDHANQDQCPGASRRMTPLPRPNYVTLRRCSSLTVSLPEAAPSPARSLIPRSNSGIPQT